MLQYTCTMAAFYCVFNNLKSIKYLDRSRLALEVTRQTLISYEEDWNHNVNLINLLLICCFCQLLARKKRNVKLLIYFPFKAFAGAGHSTAYFSTTLQAFRSLYQRSRYVALWGLSSDVVSEKEGTGQGMSPGVVGIRPNLQHGLEVSELGKMYHIWKQLWYLPNANNKVGG